MQSVSSRICFISINLAISKALSPPVPCAGVKGDLNYIHAEVLNPNPGLSK